MRSFSICLLVLLIVSACSEDKKTETWVPINAGTTAHFGNIQFPDPSMGYVSGWSSAGGTVLLKTTDGGNTWAHTSVLPDTFLSSICFLDADTGFFVGDYGIIMKTTNGGQNWIRKKAGNGDFWDVHFPSKQIGYACGITSVYKTTDGGNTWSNSLNGSGGVAVNFLNDSIGFVGTPDGVLVTANGGTSWTPHASPTGSGFTDIFAVSSNIVLAVDHNGHFLKSTDGGNTWVPKNLEVTNPLRGIWSSGGTVIFVVGDGGQIWRSEDGGDNWIREDSGTTQLLDDIIFVWEGIHGQKGFIVGFNGTILSKHFD